MRPCGNSWRQSVVLAVVLLVSVAAPAQSFEKDARTLVTRLLSELGNPSTMALEFANRSAADAAQFRAIQQAVEGELKRAGVQVTEATRAVVTIKITLSDSLPGLLLAAESTQGTNRAIVLQVLAAARNDGAATTTKGPQLQKRLLWSQPQRILDVVLLENPGETPAMLVLDPVELSMFRRSGTGWRRDGMVPVAAMRSRDPRGRLIVQPDMSLEASLPGVRCTGSARAGITISCVAADDPWPAAAGVRAFYNPARNFFSGVVTGDSGARRALPPFYSLAVAGPHVVAASVSGETLLFAATERPVAKWRGWGSDIAALSTPCSASPLVVSSGAGDWTRPDQVQAFEISAAKALPTGRAVEFEGPVTALWPAAPGRLLAVAYNLRTELYEAYAITAECGN